VSAAATQTRRPRKDTAVEDRAPSFSELADRVRAVGEARQALRRGFVGGKPAIRDALRELSAVAAGLADAI
jgi:hypothetical protein